MHDELRMATSDLANFLQEKLPGLSEQWWDKHVVDRLSFQQQRFVDEKKLSSLRELDFAALLRVLDQNWYDLADKLALPREARNWVKELQTVRNKWAHMAADEQPASEIYRDADTLGRFLTINHAAMFRHTNSTKDFMLEMFSELTSNELEVVLAQKNETLYFTKTHVADLKKIIEVERSTSINPDDDNADA